MADILRNRQSTARVLRLVKRLPYKPGPAKELNEAYRALSSEKKSTIYDAFTSSPIGLDRIVPTRWMLNLPHWARVRILGITLWQWLGFASGLLVALLCIFGCTAWHIVSPAAARMAQVCIGRR